MSAHFLFQKPAQLMMALVVVTFGFTATVFAQGSSISPTSSSATLDTEDEALAQKTSGKKGTHPDDGSDLGDISASGLEKSPVYWMCRSRSIVRTLQIESKDGGCRTHYSKDGVERIVSQSQTTGTCVNIFANIRRNLEAAGWKCKDISKARISENL